MGRAAEILGERAAKIIEADDIESDDLFFRRMKKYIKEHKTKVILEAILVPVALATLYGMYLAGQINIATYNWTKENLDAGMPDNYIEFIYNRNRHHGPIEHMVGIPGKEIAKLMHEK